MPKTLKEKVKEVIKAKKTVVKEGKEVCSNCDDSGKVCSVCHTGLDVV